MSSVWLEVSLNGSWTKKRQPNIPTDPDQIIKEAVECANAGAAIVHYHAYDRDTGEEIYDFEVNKYIIEGIRSQSDVVIYPAVNMIHQEKALRKDAGELRFNHYHAMAEADLMEWMVLDPGTCNMIQQDIPSSEKGNVYINSGSTIITGLEIAKKYGIHPSYAIYEPGFIRTGAALANLVGDVPAPIYRFMFSNQFTFGFPPEEFGLRGYLDLLNFETKGSPWMIAGIGADIRSLIPQTVELGGHVRVGLEDATLGNTKTNIELVTEAANLIEQAGGVLASPTEVRNFLKN